MDADDIIDKAIGVSGVKKLDNSVITFDFRDKHYEAGRYGGKFVLKRQFMDETDTIVDYLSNKNFERRVNGTLVDVQDSLVSLYSASVNSVHYFSVLPYGLDGKAVNKKYISDIEINGNKYHKIKVTFNKDGGGEDFEDVFIYWVNIETSKIDYLAYSYNEDDGIGLRFREAYKERYIMGVRFVDYNNYKPAKSDAELENLDKLFVENQLELLSKIELENVKFN
jgi:hypothetical protein